MTRRDRSPTRIRTALALACVALALGACRSDGGFGRKWSGRNMSWAAETMARQAGRDTQKMGEHFENLPERTGEHVVKGFDNILFSYDFYLNGKPRYAP